MRARVRVRVRVIKCAWLAPVRVGVGARRAWLATLIAISSTMP